jgi:hypothetical protein
MKKREKGRGQNAALRDNEKLHVDFNTTEAQRTRLLGYMRKVGSITTAEARELLAVMHPAGRIKELRDFGFKIPCVIQKSPDFHGVFHKMGRYFFLGEPRKGGLENAN